MKKLMVLAVCLTMLGILAVNSTFAFSTETISEIVNSFFETVADLGKPDLEQSEALAIDTIFQFRSANGLTNGKDNYLQPAETSSLSRTDIVQIGEGEYGFWPRSSGATDQIVSVKNTAEKAVYFRTAFQFSCSNALFEKLMLNLNENEDDYKWQTVKNGTYPLLIATYQKALDKGRTSPPMLLQIVLAQDAPTGKLSIETQTFAIEAEAFGEDSAETALNKAIPIENIVRSFAPATDP